MAPINLGKVVVGGLAAGLVINIVESVMNLFVIAHSMEHLRTERNLAPMGGLAMGGFIVLAFLLGLLTVWVYAAARPRLGAGPATAMKAGLVVWIAFYVLGQGGNWLMGMVPFNLYLHTLLYTLAMMLAAGYVGGMMYREE